MGKQITTTYTCSLLYDDQFLINAVFLETASKETNSRNLNLNAQSLILILLLFSRRLIAHMTQEITTEPQAAHTKPSG